MTRFIYLADSHLGANPPGYQQQPAYAQKLPHIIAALRQYIAEENNIAFVLHGGDMVDSASDENIRQAVDAFDLPCPLYLCPGNHDLTTPDALERWLNLAPHFFPNGKPEYTLQTEDCHIHVVPNHWDEIPYFWKDKQDAHFSAGQSVFLKNALNIAPALPHILLTHSPIFGVPADQTGFTLPFHAPNIEFQNTVVNLAEKHHNLRLVLGAHNHLNMTVQAKGTHFVTVSAFVETPFELKLFTATPGSLSMSTISLANHLSDYAAYDFNKTFVQGRDCDRRFEVQF